MTKQNNIKIIENIETKIPIEISARLFNELYGTFHKWVINTDSLIDEIEKANFDYEKNKEKLKDNVETLLNALDNYEQLDLENNSAFS